MPFKYSANVGFLWDHLPLPERIRSAANAGFDAVECHFPYEYPAADIRSVLESNGLTMTGLNTALGPDGCFGLAAISGKQTEARVLIDQAVAYASEIGAKNVNVVAGLTGGTHYESGGKSGSAREVYIDNLKYACEAAASHGITIMIEPLNPRAVPNYHFSTVEQAVDIIDAVDADNMKLMFDFFHAQIVQGDLETLLREYVDYFAHIQISAVHDRGEPDDGEINFPYVLRALEKAGYSGYIGAEYRPRGESVESGLSWLKQFRNM